MKKIQCPRVDMGFLGLFFLHRIPDHRLLYPADCISWTGFYSCPDLLMPLDHKRNIQLIRIKE